MEGFVKLPRSLTEWGWYGDNNMLAVYVRLFMTAAWSDFEYQIKTRSTCHNFSKTRGAVRTFSASDKIFDQ